MSLDFTRRRFLATGAAAATFAGAGTQPRPRQVAQQADQDHRRLSRRRTDRFVCAHLWRLSRQAARTAGAGREQGWRRRHDRRRRSEARPARRLYADVHDLDDGDHEPRA